MGNIKCASLNAEDDWRNRIKQNKTKLSKTLEESKEEEKNRILKQKANICTSRWYVGKYWCEYLSSVDDHNATTFIKTSLNHLNSSKYVFRVQFYLRHFRPTFDIC